MLVRLTFTAIIAFVATSVTFAAPPSIPLQAQNEDPAQIRDLAERLLATTSTGTGIASARLFVGQLPPGLPFDVPIPAGGRLVGSVEKSIGGEASGIDIAIEAPGSPASILDFYDVALPARGLFIAPASMSGGGFQSAFGKRLDMYCVGEDGPWLYVYASERRDGLNDVKMSVTSGTQVYRMPPGYRGPCSAESVSSRYPGTYRSLPRLSGPPGVPLQMGYGGYGADSSSATASTEMTVAQLERFFADQLSAAGWSRTTGGADGPLAWSMWRLPEGDDVRGFFYVVEGPGANRRHMSLQVQSADPSFPSSPSVMFYYP